MQRDFKEDAPRCRRVNLSDLQLALGRNFEDRMYGEGHSSKGKPMQRSEESEHRAPWDLGVL